MAPKKAWYFLGGYGKMGVWLKVILFLSAKIKFGVRFSGCFR